MNKKQKKTLGLISISLFLFACVMIVAHMNLFFNNTLKFLAFFVVYLLIGKDVIIKAIKNARRGELFDENSLMSIATLGAFLIGEYPEAVAVMLLYNIGEFFQSYALNHSRKSIAALMDIRAPYANMVDSVGNIIEVDPCVLKKSDLIIIKVGEKVPTDSKIVEGSTLLDTSALSGESIPKEVNTGDEILSGFINLSGTVKAEVIREYNDSAVSKILDLVENASNKKAKTENFITKFARYYTPLIVIFALILAIIPPLFFLQSWQVWLQRALILLVISCPCALVISVPLTFFGGLGGASRQGILVKGSNYLEVLAKAKTVVFDKTGTLTKGVFKVSAIHPDIISEEKLLEYAVLAQSYSNHPISSSLKNAYGKIPDLTRVKESKEIAGHGVEALIDGKNVYVGNAKLMDVQNIPYCPCELPGTLVHVALEHEYMGHIVISDEIKEGAHEAILKLKAEGIQKTVILSGDLKSVGEYTAKRLDVDEIYTELLPQDKVECLEKLLEEKPKNSSLIYVGDGINDAPVLSLADVGIAMGALGSDAAVEAADVVIMDDDPKKVPLAILIARKTLYIAKQNIVFALSVKALVILLGIFGLANMWEAVFADVGVTLIAILNSTRALMVDKKRFI